MNLTVNFSQSTQYGPSFGVNLLNQDGYTAGRLSNIDVDSNGVVFARFTNGRSDPLGQVALSNFANTQGLRQLGDTSWAETFTFGRRDARLGRHRQLRADPVGRAGILERRPHRSSSST